MMPGFFKLMPPCGSGQYEAVVLRTTIRGRREVVSVKCNGRRWAYFCARFWALVEDLTCPSFNGEIGIEWEVRGVA